MEELLEGWAGVDESIVDESNINNADEDLVVKQVDRKEVKTASAYTREEALSLVGLYYSIQKTRVGATNKLSAHERNVDIVSNPVFIESIKSELHKVEKQTARGLKAYADAQPLGTWCQSLRGLSYITTAGLLAHINLHVATNPAKIIRFAGLDPTIQWNKGEKRPYNAHLKTLCWKIGTAFKMANPNEVSVRGTDEELAVAILEEVKKKGTSLTAEGLLEKIRAKRQRANTKADLLSGEDCLYVRLYKERKKREIAYNEEGRFRDDALRRLEKALESRWRVSDEVKECWRRGKLPPHGLDLRAMRYAVTIFLHHYYHVGRSLEGLTVSRPWIVEPNLGGHSDYIYPPNLHVVGLKKPKW